MINKKQFRIFTILDLDKEEEYLHEMHLKGWRYRTSSFGFFYFDQCQPNDVIYRIYDSRFLKKHKYELQDFRNRGWGLIGAGSCSILRKSSSNFTSRGSSLYEQGSQVGSYAIQNSFMYSDFLRWFCCLYESI